MKVLACTLPASSTGSIKGVLLNIISHRIATGDTSANALHKLDVKLRVHLRHIGIDFTIPKFLDVKVFEVSRRWKVLQLMSSASIDYGTLYSQNPRVNVQKCRRLFSPLDNDGSSRPGS